MYTTINIYILLHVSCTTVFCRKGKQ